MFSFSNQYNLFLLIYICTNFTYYQVVIKSQINITWYIYSFIFSIKPFQYFNKGKRLIASHVRYNKKMYFQIPDQFCIPLWPPNRKECKLWPVIRELNLRSSGPFPPIYLSIYPPPRRGGGVGPVLPEGIIPPPQGRGGGAGPGEPSQIR